MRTTMVLVVALTTLGCVGAPTQKLEPLTPRLGAQYPIQETPPEEPTAAPDPTGMLTLEEALGLALQHSPRLHEAAWDVRAAQARAVQAGLWSNPEVGVEAEEFGGEDARHGFEAAEFTVALGQELELPWKRTLRRQGAQQETTLARYRQEQARLEVLTRTRIAFEEVVAAQGQLALAQERLELTREQLEAVALRVAAGKVPALEESKARVALALSRQALSRSQLQLTAARTELAATWGSDRPTFEGVMPVPDRSRHVPSLAAMLQSLPRNPILQGWVVELERRRTRVSEEEIAWLPDPRAEGALKHFNEDDGDAFAAGLEMALPIFDRNQGGRAEARAELAGGLAAQREAEVEVRTALTSAHIALATAAAEANGLEHEILPAAEEAYAASREGFDQGKLGYLEVLDAQRTLFEVQEQYIEARAAYRVAVARCEGLIAQELEQLERE